MKKIFVLLIVILVFTAASLTVAFALFSDTAESTNNTFSAAESFGPPIANHLVINEVYFAVDSTHKGQGAESRWEWVELYNPTSFDIDLTGWSISDDNSTDTLPGSVVVHPGEFVIVSPSSQAELTDSSNNGGRWTFPAGTLFIDLTDTDIGSGFNNGGDRVIIRDDLNAEVDRMSWGTDTTGFSSGCSGNCPNVATGHSLERDPDGIDTDTAGDFTDRNPPTPGS